MRVFIAIDIPSDARDYLFNLQKEFSGVVKAKWASKKNIHQTLKFLGEIDEDKLDKVKGLLKKIRFKKFKVSLDEVGVFPNEKFIRVIWIGLKGEEILNLQKKIDESLLGLFPDEQRFLSHITLGRVKMIKDKEKFREFLKDLKIKKIGFVVDNFKLYKSELTKDGPRYSVLEEYKLE